MKMDVYRIPYEGPKSRNPLAFKHYNAEEIVDGKRMSEHLNFSIAFWHAFNYEGRDLFGDETIEKPWREVSDPMKKALMKIDTRI